MHFSTFLAAAMFLAAPIAAAEPRRDPAAPLVPISGFNHAELLGDWFEIAQTPTILERDCHGTTSRVELRDDSRLTLRIACTVGFFDGPVLPIDGIMVETEPGVFMVRLVRLPQMGNLQVVVIWLAPDKSLVTLGSPLGDIGWIWGRSALPDEALLEEARQALVGAGYSPTAIRAVEHPGG